MTNIFQNLALGIVRKEIDGYKTVNEIDKQVQMNLQERLAELELALEDVGWMRIAYGDDAQQFSREALGKISYLSRIMYLKNPLINRGVTVKRNYVWGQDVQVKSKDPDIDKIIQQFWKDRKNKQELTGHSAQTTKETDLECDGNVFLIFFVDALNTGRVQVRSIPFSQIIDIITNPDDAKENWFYVREWIDAKGVAHKAYYPDWNYLPDNQSSEKDSIPIMWKSPVMHKKIGGFSDWKFGISEVYSALDWAKAYKEFLEDWATITRSYARFAWKASTKGGTAARTAIKNKFQTNITEGSGIVNKPPAPGSIAITDATTDMQPIKTSGATTSPEDGRRILLMVAAAVGLPETFFGDVSVGTLATATSLDRPTELTMLDRQAFWRETLTDVLNFVLVWAVKSKKLTGKATLVKMENSMPQLDWKDGDFQDNVTITFPAILQTDKDRDVQAVVNAATLGGNISAGIIDDENLTRLILTALGEKNIDQVMDHMKDKKDGLSQTIESFIEKYHLVRK